MTRGTTRAAGKGGVETQAIGSRAVSNGPSQAQLVRFLGARLPPRAIFTIFDIQSMLRA